MEIIYHILGICPDAHSHLDMTDLYATWDSLSLYFCRISFFLIKLKIAVLEFFK